MSTEILKEPTALPVVGEPVVNGIDGSAPKIPSTEAPAHINGTSTGIVKKPVVDVSVALKANNLGSVAELTQEISSLGAQVSSGDEQARLALVEKARSLVRALETPRETMIKHCWAQVSTKLSRLPPTHEKSSRRISNNFPAVCHGGTHCRG